MSQIFDKDGNAIPVTLIQAGPLVVTQIKTKDKDGYEAVQVGFGDRKEKNIKKPQRGHLKKAGAKNAALLAAAILALSDEGVAGRLDAFRKKQSEAIAEVPAKRG